MTHRFLYRALQCLFFGHRWFDFRLEGGGVGRCCTRCLRMEQQVLLPRAAKTAWAPLRLAARRSSHPF